MPNGGREVPRRGGLRSRAYGPFVFAREESKAEARAIVYPPMFDTPKQSTSLFAPEARGSICRRLTQASLMKR